MDKKLIMLALSVMSAALFALPAIASATPAHINATSTFTVSKGAVTSNAVLETTGGEKIECLSGVSGSGNFETTTTGSLNLEFHGCTAPTIFGNLTCTSHASEGGTGISGTISTTALPFHLIRVEPAGQHAGVLITPNAQTGFFAHFTCGGGLVTKTVTGNGVIGTITTPTCGGNGTTATLKFEQGATTGLQKHTTYTGVNYHLHADGGTKAAQVAEGQIHFAAGKTITCT